MSLPTPRSRGSQIYLVQLLVVAVGLALVIAGLWRAGLLVVGASFIVSAFARLVVPSDHVGMLRVRGKAFDVFWTGALGVALVALALVVPPR